MKTLKLFYTVLAKESSEKPFISDDGFVIDSNAIWAKKEIIKYFSKEKLSGKDLNATFHKSWKTIKYSTRNQLLVEQVLHYISTYGSNFQDEIYIPNEILNIPDAKLSFKVIKGISKDEMIEKCLNLLNSGIALQEETIDDVFSILIDELDYKFTGNENIKNKEAIAKIADLFHIYPENPVEFFRYIIYKSAQTTLLIKNDEVISAIKESKFNPSQAFKDFGLEKMAEIFNRFKPLFLAFKNKCPKTINAISKLSKKHHKPLVSNPLNDATNQILTENDLHWLENATPFALFKALSACYNRMNGQDTFAYRIRNGKSWVQKDVVKNVNKKNYDFILQFLKSKFDFTNLKIYIPEEVKYALPTSEKMFVGNIPTGTRFYGKKLAIGIYWEDSWGAHDLDLSGLNIGGKIGWNSSYKQDEGNLMYSGDMTSAPNGAVEYLYANKGLNYPTLILNSIYSGDSNCDYKIIVGKGEKISKEYMMNPNAVFAEIKCKSVQRQTVLGMLLPKNDKQCFVLLNFGAGQSRVSGTSKLSTLATTALYQQWNRPLTFNKLVSELGAHLVYYKDGVDYDFSLENLEKDSFIKLFQRN